MVTAIIAVILIIITIVLVFVFPKPLLRDRIIRLFRSPEGESEKFLLVLEKNPNDIKALDCIAQIYFNNNNYEEAYSYYSRLIVQIANSSASQVYVNRYLIYLNFGICAYHLGEHSESLTSLQKAKLVVNDMHTFDLFHCMGLIHFANENFLEASAALQTAHEQDPEHQETMGKLGISYYKLSQYETARPLLAELEDPENPNDITFYLASCMFYQEDTKAAIPKLEALSCLPEFQVKAWFHLANIYLEGGRGEKVSEMCENIIQKSNSQDVDSQYLCFAYYQMAKLLAKRGSVGEANQVLSELMEINPNYEDTAVLQKRYANSEGSLQLFNLLEGDAEVREKLIRKLVPHLVPDASEIEVVDLGPSILVVIVHCSNNRNKYYVWLSLQNNEVTMRQVFQAHLNSKEFRCSHCVFACISDFEAEIEAYIEGRLIRLVANAELKSLLNQVAD